MRPVPVPLAFPPDERRGKDCQCFQVFALNEQTAKLLQKVSEGPRDAALKFF